MYVYIYNVYIYKSIYIYICIHTFIDINFTLIIFFNKPQHFTTSTDQMYLYIYIYIYVYSYILLSINIYSRIHIRPNICTFLSGSKTTTAALGAVSFTVGRAPFCATVMASRICNRPDDDVYLDKLQTRGVKKSIL
jgi:hypothetical protein